MTDISEYSHGKLFTSWLRGKGLRFTHIPNGANLNVTQRVKMKQSGLSAGTPDYMILLPQAGLIFIELKKLKGGTVSKEQKEWITALNWNGIPAKVCKGHQEAIAFVETFL